MPGTRITYHSCPLLTRVLACGRVPGAAWQTAAEIRGAEEGRGRAIARGTTATRERRPEGLAAGQGRWTWGRGQGGQGQVAAEARSEGIWCRIVSAARIVWSRIYHDDQKSLKEGEQ